MVSIKTKEEIALIKESGHITYLTHQYLKSLIKPGITTKYIDTVINVMADTEDEAKEIAYETKFSIENISEPKMKFDFGSYYNKIKGE